MSIWEALRKSLLWMQVAWQVKIRSDVFDRDSIPSKDRTQLGSLWQYYRDDPNDDITESESFQYKFKITGKIPLLKYKEC